MVLLFSTLLFDLVQERPDHSNGMEILKHKTLHSNEVNVSSQGRG